MDLYMLIQLVLRMVCNKQMPYRLCLLTLLQKMPLRSPSKLGQTETEWNTSATSLCKLC
jgi:hypothetical protein